MKSIAGLVNSVGMKKTAVVEVTRRKPHPLYRKLIRKSKKYKVDTNGFEVKVGDKVKISSTRPISKTKNFRITEITEFPKKEKK